MENRGSAPEHGGIAVGDMKVHQQRAARHEPRQRGRHVDGNGGRAPPFAPTNASAIPLSGSHDR